MRVKIDKTQVLMRQTRDANYQTSELFEHVKNSSDKTAHLCKSHEDSENQRDASFLIVVLQLNMSLTLQYEW